jgi:predicted nucleic acid-binding protein
MPDYRTVISPLVSAELGRVKEPHRSSYLKLISNLEQVDLTEEAAILAEGYISRGIFHRKYIADALHVAIASFHKIDYLVTWNFGHLANVRRQARIKLFNTAAGFYVPMIVTPEFLVSEATEQQVI